jgi:hypothetical protein
MGFNVSGIVINKNYKDNLDALQKEFNWNLEFDKEIYFQTASENWKEEGLCDIYFSEQGTLLFLNMDMCLDPWSVKNGNVLTFVLSETSMAFKLDYYEADKQLRSIMEVNGERISDDGEQLQIEETEQDTSEIIWGQIENVLGEKFWNIEPDAKSYRYRFVSKEKEIPNPDKRMVDKKWWQFWK